MDGVTGDVQVSSDKKSKARSGSPSRSNVCDAASKPGIDERRSEMVVASMGDVARVGVDAGVIIDAALGATAALTERRSEVGSSLVGEETGVAEDGVHSLMGTVDICVSVAGTLMESECTWVENMSEAVDDFAEKGIAEVLLPLS